ncbi:MAG: methionyl-tRNA formyltransferase [Candidatus Saccharimonadales bacterium]
MTKTSATVVFFGNERLATGVSTNTPVLKALIDNGYKVGAIIANYDKGSSRNVRDLEVASVAKQHDIPLLLPNKLEDIKTQLQDIGATVGVLVAYGKMVPQSIIDIFPHGIINLHPSLLPLHRGPTPLESVILGGSSKTGVSLMQLAKAMDAGSIYAQSELELTGTETKQALADILLDIGTAMIIDLMPGILSGSVVSAPQDETAASYDSLIKKEDGTLDWSKPAEQLEREIRAYAEWPKSRLALPGKEVVVTKAHVASGNGPVGTIWRDGKSFGIYTAQNILVIDRLKPAGKQDMSAEAFLAGYQLG